MTPMASQATLIGWHCLELPGAQTAEGFSEPVLWFVLGICALALLAPGPPGNTENQE